MAVTRVDEERAYLRESAEDTRLDHGDHITSSGRRWPLGGTRP